MRFPIEEYLTPVPSRASDPKPEEKTLDVNLVRGIPHQMELMNNVHMVLVVPTGNASLWQQSDPDQSLSNSASQQIPATLNEENYSSAFDRVPARLIVRSGSELLASIALTTGLTAEVSTPVSINNLLIEITIKHWEIRTGNMRGPGDFGGRIVLSWRTKHNAVAHYSTPPVNPYLIPRLHLSFKMHSLLGRKLPIAMARFTGKQRQLKSMKLS